MLKLCSYCKIEFKSRYTKDKYHWTRFCSLSCAAKDPNRPKRKSKRTKEEKRLDANKAAKRYYHKNKSNLEFKRRVSQLSQKYRKQNPGKYAHIEALRYARKCQRTPQWLSKKQIKEIQNIYKKCPKGYHVDHIIPLNGKQVSGLHAPWNLQYLSASVNMSKGNKLLV